MHVIHFRLGPSGMRDGTSPFGWNELNIQSINCCAHGSTRARTDLRLPRVRECQGGRRRDGAHDGDSGGERGIVDSSLDRAGHGRILARFAGLLLSTRPFDDRLVIICNHATSACALRGRAVYLAEE